MLLKLQHACKLMVTTFTKLINKTSNEMHDYYTENAGHLFGLE